MLVQVEEGSSATDFEIKSGETIQDLKGTIHLLSVGGAGYAGHRQTARAMTTCIFRSNESSSTITTQINSSDQFHLFKPIKH